MENTTLINIDSNTIVSVSTLNKTKTKQIAVDITTFHPDELGIGRAKQTLTMKPKTAKLLLMALTEQIKKEK